MTDRRPTSPSPSGATVPSPETRPPYLHAALAGLAVFALYGLTLSPTTAFWDTSEYIATGHILGVPHPPGNPLFVILARTWEVLLGWTGLSVAVRINLFSAAMSAGAHGLWFLVVHHVLRYFSEERVFRLVGAACAVLVSATAFTVWNQSNVNEKVYTVSLATIALLSWLLFRWQENLGRGKDDNLLILMAFILALSVGNHLMAFLAAPAMAVFVLMVHPRVLLNWKLYPAVVVVGLLGLSVHLYLPIRAALDPVINEADPTCPTLGSALAAVATYGNAGCQALSEALTRQQYDKPPLLPRLAPFHSQMANYFQYFDWQWARSLMGGSVLFAPARLPFTLLFAGLGVWGATRHARRDRPSFAYVLVLWATLSLGLVFYLNFRYGFSIPAPVSGSDLHEVRERDYFFIAGFSVWGLWAGLGIAALWQRVAERTGRGLAAASPVLLLALLPLALNWSWATRAYDWATRDWAYNLLMSVEPYGVLFTNGDNDTFPLWYLQEVEGLRRDVTVIVTSYLNTDWYTKQLRDLTRPCPPDVDPLAAPTRILCQRPYAPAADARAVYTASPEEARGTERVALVLDAPVRPPDRPILQISDSIIAQVAQTYVPLEQARTVDLGGIQATLPGGQYLFPWHQFALAIISQSAGVRPIYFASSGNAAQTLGVADYLVRQGLAFKLHDGPLPETAGPGLVAMASSPLRSVTGPWLDVPRTRTLVEEVFVHRGGIPDWDHWPDRSTVGIPNYYAWVYYALAQAAGQEGDEELLERWRAEGDRWGLLGAG